MEGIATGAQDTKGSQTHEGVNGVNHIQLNTKRGRRRIGTKKETKAADYDGFLSLKDHKYIKKSGIYNDRVPCL